MVFKLKRQKNVIPQIYKLIYFSVSIDIGLKIYLLILVGSSYGKYISNIVTLSIEIVFNS